MEITPLEHANHQLDQLAGQFEHWRQTRPHPWARIPEPLWEQAVAFAAVLAPSRVAKQLRLRLADLQRHIASQQELPSLSTPGVVEVPLPPPPAPLLGGLEVELYRPDGTRLRLHAPGACLATLVHSFVEA
jgi:hypothetical protein